MDPIRELRKKAQKHIEAAGAILEKAEKENRDLTDAENEEYTDLTAEAEKLQKRAARLEEHRDRELAAQANAEERKAEGAEDEPKANEDLPKEKEERKGEVKVGNDRQARARLAFNTLRMMQAISRNNNDEIRNAQRDLARDGWYGEEAQQRAAGDWYATNQDADGGYLLPTVVVREIEEIGEVYGV